MCDNCGLPKREHWVTNFADGPHITGEVLICPDSVFRPFERGRAGLFARMVMAMSRSRTSDGSPRRA